MAEKKAVRQTVKAKSEQEGQKMVKAKSEHKGQKTMLPPGPADSDPRFLTLDALFAKVRHLHYHRAVTFLEELGLFFGQPPVLFALWKRDGQTQTEIARWMLRTPATVTATLNRMERDGWVARRPDGLDHRVTRVHLTQKGMDIRPEVEARLNQLDVMTFAGFDDGERDQLRKFLIRMEKNLDFSGNS